NILAKALYDNVAESPDELSFRKGDIMTVLERDTQGLDGWWLCSLHGRQGIVPGNRLKILVGMYDSRQGPDQSQRPLPKTAPSDIYQVPPSLGQDIYQVPPSLGPLPGQIPAPVGGTGTGQDVYQDIYQVPPSLGPLPGQIPAPVGGTGTGQDVYQVVRDAQSGVEDVSVSFKRLSACSTGSTHSSSSCSLDLVPVRDPSAPQPPLPPPLALDLDLDQAMELLSRLTQAVESGVAQMMSLVSGNWRGAGRLEAVLPAMRAASERARGAVRDFLDFARDAAANAGRAPDRSLQAKLSRQVSKMEDGFRGLVRHGQALDAAAWSHVAMATAATAPGGDDLDRLIMAARGIPDDAKQLASFLHGNASLLFRRTNRTGAGEGSGGSGGVRRGPAVEARRRDGWRTTTTCICR
ncbi:unnamed protein product, partial [Menidia menidia]